MKAFVVEKYGKSGLRAAQIPEPGVGPRDVLVRVSAASINPLDKMIRNGEFKLLLKYKTPFVLGHDVAGVVTRVGADVRDYKVGDEVYARPRDLRIGTFAEYIAIDHADVALKPSSLTMEESAAVPLVALAAWQVLVNLAQLKPGQKVLVHAGAGGLGSTVVQLAKHLGAYVATTAHGNDEEKLRSLGANEVIDYTKADFAELLSSYDIVLDSLGGDNLAKSLTVLKPGGLAISVVGPPDSAFAEQIGRPLLKPVMALMSRKVRAQARKLGVRYSFFFMRADGAQLKKLAALYDAGTLRPVLDRTFPFDETLDAIGYVEQGRAKGKIAVTMVTTPLEKRGMSVKTIGCRKRFLYKILAPHCGAKIGADPATHGGLRRDLGLAPVQRPNATFPSHKRGISNYEAIISESPVVTCEMVVKKIAANSNNSRKSVLLFVISAAVPFECQRGNQSLLG
jgi:NADPH:quinone reductase-like Zn-dependent oxidoreductase